VAPLKPRRYLVACMRKKRSTTREFVSGPSLDDPPRAHFLFGMSSVLGLFGLYPLPRLSSNPFADDAKALESDWRAVGADLLDATEAGRGR
jgi:hypothetical protein